MASRPAASGRALGAISGSQDPKLLADLQNAHDDNATLQERFQKLQVQCTQVLREKTAMQSQIEAMSAAAGDSDESEALRAQIDQLQQELAAAYESQSQSQQQQEGAGTEQLMRELHEMQDANASLSQDLDAARADLDSRLERSAPFTNLKQMLQKKSQVVRRLREELRAHNIAFDDVDATED